MRIGYKKWEKIVRGEKKSRIGCCVEGEKQRGSEEEKVGRRNKEKERHRMGG